MSYDSDFGELWILLDSRRGHYNILIAGPPQAMKPAFLFCLNPGRSLRSTMSTSNGYHHMLTLEIFCGYQPPGVDLTYVRSFEDKKQQQLHILASENLRTGNHLTCL
ncbi:hypothetical protein TNCV_335471 [Trichonephila clavipes]|nr:hypothetical protein TNCV_335471 [Trichonephila clavipes]